MTIRVTITIDDALERAMRTKLGDQLRPRPLAKAVFKWRAVREFEIVIGQHIRLLLADQEQLDRSDQ